MKLEFILTMNLWNRVKKQVLGKPKLNSADPFSNRSFREYTSVIFYAALKLLYFNANINNAYSADSLINNLKRESRTKS